MQLWQKQIILLQRTTTTLGNTVNFLAQQDSIISEVLIGITGIISTAAATANPEGLTSIIQNVRITGSLNVGGNVNPINNVRGPQLAELAQFIRANTSFSYGSLTSTGAFGCYVPCTFEHARLGAPLQRFMSCLPANQMGNLNFNVTVSNQNQMDTNGTPTLAFSNITISVYQLQFFVGTIDPNFQYLISTVDQQLQSNPQTGTGQQQQFPNGAAYLNILIRSLSDTTTATRTCVTKQADGVSGPIDVSSTTFGIVLLDSNNIPKSQTDYETLREDNANNISGGATALIAGNACFQFNQSLSRIWRPTPGPSIVPMNIGYNISGTTNATVEFIFQRLFDPNNVLALA
jgi:hypothetical protein